MDKIAELEGEIIDLKFDLKESKDKQLIYLDILNNIQTGIDDLFQREHENERFHFNENIDYREALINLNKSLQEYKRVYKIDF
jgi:hypothetical protein